MTDAARTVRVAARALARAGLVHAYGHCSERIDAERFLTCPAMPIGLVPPGEPGRRQDRRHEAEGNVALHAVAQAPATNIVEVRQVAMTFGAGPGRHVVFEDISFEVELGGFLCIVGSSNTPVRPDWNAEIKDKDFAFHVDLNLELGVMRRRVDVKNLVWAQR